MNIYRIAMYDKATADRLIEADVEEVSFAHFSALGTWSKGKGLCKSCQASSQTCIEPLLVQWEPSSDVIGDFSWDGPWGYIFIVTEPTAAFLRQHNFECTFLEVEYVPTAKETSNINDPTIPSDVVKNLPPEVASEVARKVANDPSGHAMGDWPHSTTSRKRAKKVPFPYRGPKQFWGKCETFVDLDLEASNVELKSDCSVCGRKKYTFRYEGIVIPRSNWHGEKMFRITTNGKSAATFVTEEGRRLIEEVEFSNIAFRSAGEILEK